MSAAAWIAVALLGGAMAVARFALDAILSDHPIQPFPLGILVVNLTGTLVLGVAAGAALGGEALTIVAGGVTGSFTTFSTWMLDTERLADSGRADLASSTSASRCSPASPPSPSATGSAGRSEQGKAPRSPSAAVSTLNRETKERRRWKSRRRRRR
jgi:fluoride exporter